MSTAADLEETRTDLGGRNESTEAFQSHERLKTSPSLAPLSFSDCESEPSAAPRAAPPRTYSEHNSSPMSATLKLASPAGLRAEPGLARVGPYEIVCELASGGMASVYLAVHRSVEGFQKLCAVKRVHPHLANERAFTEMFVDEAQIAARVSHPYVCSVFSFGRWRDSHYIAMEFLRGEPLSAIARRLHRAPHFADDPRFPLLAARLLANLAEGLHAAHTLRDEQGALLDVVHRDVTPQNLFVLYDGSVRVTDFGIARARGRLHQTQEQKLKGKLSYIAPELLNRKAADARVDIWGLGVVLWELLAGRRLFLCQSEGETIAAVLSRAIVPPSTFRATVPPELDRIVLRALDRNAEQRYQTARSFARDLEQFLKASADAVPAMDIADWMAELFPDGAARIQELMELAAHVARASIDHTPDDTALAVAGNNGPASFPTLPVATAIYEARPLSKAVEAPIAPAVTRAPPKRRSRVNALAGSSLALIAALGVWTQAPRARSLRAPAPLAAPVIQSAASPRASTASYVVAPPSASAAPLNDSEKRAQPPAHAVNTATVAHVRRAAAQPLTAAVSTPHPAPTSSATTPPTTNDAGSAASGDVYVTTPGGSLAVSTGGRSLGRTPGKFRLSVGQHELSLQSDSGTVTKVLVLVVADSPTLITLPLVH